MSADRFVQGQDQEGANALQAHQERAVAFARRQTDVHAGLALERLLDLNERLMRLANALTSRGDDLAALMVENKALELKGLHELLSGLEQGGHARLRDERSP